MEKLIYTIWNDRSDAAPSDSLRDALAAELARGLAAIDTVRGAQLNLPDPAFSGGQEPIRNLLPRFDGTVSVWLGSRRERAPVETLLAQTCGGFHGYAVCESRAMQEALPAADERGRVDALSQVCLLRKPDGRDYDEWLSIWLDSHTDIAIERQGTVAYLQNIVQAPVTADAPAIHGIVEECYPPKAYRDYGLFFGAPADPTAMRANIEALMASTARFVPTHCLDRIFTARYLPTLRAASSASTDGTLEGRRVHG